MFGKNKKEDKAVKPEASKKGKTKKIKFTKSPTGAFGLAYFPEQKAELPAHQVDELVEAGYGEEVK